MSVIIRLQNLPWSANALDIRQYFQGLSIPEGGVHIVGGELGDAFIAFSTDEDARQAMLIDGGKIKEVKIKLFLSSRSEMQKVIETARAQTLSLQNFMQLPAPPIIQQIPIVPGPVLPIVNQIPLKGITADVKTPLHQTPFQQPVTHPSVLQPPALVIPSNFTETAISSEKKLTPGPNMEMESNELDSESRDKKDRRDQQSTRSLSREKSHDRSRERSKSRDRRELRNRDRYRDRRRRDRSRSRDRRRRNRDRSRSRERSSRKNSRERKRDYDKSSPSDVDKSHSKNKSPSIEKKISELSQEGTKQDFKSSNYTPANDSKPLTNNDITTKPSIVKNESISNISDKNVRSGVVFPTPNMPSTPFLKNEMISQQPSNISQRRMDMFPSILNNHNNENLKSSLFQENWPANQTSHNFNRSLITDREQKKPGGPSFGVIGLNNINRPGNNPPNSSYRVDNNVNRSPYPSQNYNEHVQPMFHQNPDMRSNSNFIPSCRSNFEMDGPLEGRNFKPGPLIDRPMVRQNPPSVGRLNIRHDTLLNEKLNQRQDGNNERGIKPEYSNERGNFHQESYRQDLEERGVNRPFQNNDRFIQGENFDRPSLYSQRSFFQRGKYNNSCIEVRNMSPTTAYSDLRRFFHGLFIPGDGIKMINDCQGNRIGIAYIRFAKPYCKEQALKKNGSYLKNTLVEVLHINDDLFDKAVDGSFLENPSQIPDKRIASSNEEMPNEDEFLSLAIREFPPYTKEKDIHNIFKGWKLADCFLLPKSGRRNASAYVKFLNVEDARKALTATSRYMIGNRKIHVSICYDHEFQDARDIKNMEEDEDDRLIIDTKDDGLSKTPDARSPPKDPRIDTKLNIQSIDYISSLDSGEIKNPFQPPGFSYPQAEVLPPKMSNQKSETMLSETIPQIDSLKTESKLKNESEIDFQKPNIHHSTHFKSNLLESKNSRVLLPTPNTLPSPMENFELDQRKFKQISDCIIMKGLPYQANDRDIIDFFAEVEVVPTQIHIMLDKMGHPAGDAFCEFSTVEEAELAIKKHNTSLGRSFITVLPVSRKEMCEALGMALAPECQVPGSFPPRGPHMIHRGGMRGRYQPNFHPRPYHFDQRLPPLMGYDHRNDLMINKKKEEELDEGTSVDNFGRPGCVIALENVPFKADVDEIISFFRGFDVSRENIIRRYDEHGRPTGDARVSLPSPQEAQRALKVLIHKLIRHREIYMHLLS